MSQMQRVVSLVLALLLVAVPAITMAQSSSGGSSPSGAGSSSGGTSTSPGSTSGGGTSTTPGGTSSSPSSTGGMSSGSSSAGQASPAMPMSAEDCKNMGWQKFGAKSEAECTAKVTTK